MKDETWPDPSPKEPGLSEIGMEAHCDGATGGRSMRTPAMTDAGTG